MTRVTDLNASDAAAHFLKGESYFRDDLPPYISFERLLEHASDALSGTSVLASKTRKPYNFSGVNYSFLANKDGRFAWRPYELIHPLLYVSLVNEISHPETWPGVQSRFN